jgi:hypothetical protein
LQQSLCQTAEHRYQVGESDEEFLTTLSLFCNNFANFVASGNIFRPEKSVFNRIVQDVEVDEGGTKEGQPDKGVEPSDAPHNFVRLGIGQGIHW